MSLRFWHRTLLIALLAGKCWNFKTVELIPYLVAARSATIQVERKGNKSMARMALFGKSAAGGQRWPISCAKGPSNLHCPHLENCSDSYTNCFGTRWRMPHDQWPERDCPPRHNLSHAPHCMPWMPRHLKNVMMYSTVQDRIIRWCSIHRHYWRLF